MPRMNVDWSLPGFHTIEDERISHPWCLPDLPLLERHLRQVTSMARGSALFSYSQFTSVKWSCHFFFSSSFSFFFLGPATHQ